MAVFWAGGREEERCRAPWLRVGEERKIGKDVRQMSSFRLNGVRNQGREISPFTYYYSGRWQETANDDVLIADSVVRGFGRPREREIDPSSLLLLSVILVVVVVFIIFRTPSLSCCLHDFSFCCVRGGSEAAEVGKEVGR